ncbi:MAG: cyclic pyranopterin monophosphate synthase MoaC [Gracilibacteraceae bacterium]|nr:cyclic pyranopterin monophosphate synthase MoaC [Gracilibacteraceae bacterium]
MPELTHFNEQGRARMVDVSAKTETARRAVARGEVRMRPETFALIREGRAAKGDVLAVAQVAAVMAAKNTASLIPMCHPLFLSAVNVSFHLNEAENKVEIAAEVKNNGQTGVEMEALTAVSVAALTIYDMCKSAEKTMEITGIALVRKSGGKSGDYRRED